MKASDPAWRAACRAISGYAFGEGCGVKPLYRSENAVFAVVSPDGRPEAVLRVSRPGYRGKEEMEAEARWLERLAGEPEIPAVRLIRARDGRASVWVREGTAEYGCLAFSYLEGTHPDPLTDPEPEKDFYETGRLAARLHRQVREWPESRGLCRPEWNWEHMVGRQGLFGDWRKCQRLAREEKELLETACAAVKDRLDGYEKTPRTFGLIHGDLRAANLLKQNGRLQILDFDDSGFGWFLYDLAASLSFVETDPRAETWAGAWIAGYQAETARMPEGFAAGETLRQEDWDLAPAMILARRIQLLAWVTSHGDSDPVRQMEPGFAEGTVALARRFLRDGSLRPGRRRNSRGPYVWG